MERLYAVCCGIDVHKKILVACLRTKQSTEIRSFGASTQDLLDLVDWLTANQCEAVAMESTASYWKPVFNILEGYDLNPMVVNAQHMKQVPGRKTDVKDAKWISDLLMNGLLKPSFIPNRRQRELRELCRYRKSLIVDLGAEKNRLQKMLEGANIKLSGTISDINGKSGKALLDYIVSGEIFDDEAYERLLAEKLISKRLKAPKKQLIKDMQGCISPIQAKMIKVIRTHISELEAHIKELNDDISNHLNEEEENAVELIKDIPGISDTSAQTIVSIIGTDMSRFPTSGALCSWGGLCPGNHESAGKRKNGRTNKGNKLLRSTLVVCAHSAVLKKDSYFGEMYKRIASHRGRKRAIVAVAHAILQIIWQLLKKNERYEDLGSDYFEKKNHKNKLVSTLKRLENFGITLMPEQLAQVAF